MNGGRRHRPLRRAEREELIACVLLGSIKRAHNVGKAERGRLLQRGLIKRTGDSLDEREIHDPVTGELTEVIVEMFYTFGPTPRGRHVVSTWRQTYVETGSGSYVPVGLMDHKVLEAERALYLAARGAERELFRLVDSGARFDDLHEAK